MRIEVVRYRVQASRDPAAYPRLVLERGRAWEDWPTTEPTSWEEAYRTLFDVYYEEASGAARCHPLGPIKILQRGRTAPELAEIMGSLTDDYCSIGQILDYYAALGRLDAETRRAILTALRDVSAHEEIARAFEAEHSFRASLLRFSEADLAFRRQAGRAEAGGAREDPPSFRFRAPLQGFDEPHEVDFQFSGQPRRLRRLAVIVGENGTGKTQLLARLANVLWGLRRTGEVLDPPRPAIGRVIAVSYSALDAFERPPHRTRGIEGHPALDNYCYCGFRDKDDALRPELLFDLMKQDLAEIRRWGRQAKWQRMLQDLRFLDREPDLAAAVEQGDGAVAAVAGCLAAGEKTVLSVLTRLLAKLRDRSFVIFDEPETNLHPSLLAGLLRVLHGWLEDFDGWGVIATHSPLVLQEIPGQMVSVLERQGRVPFLRPYQGESFGQSLSEIVVEVFGADERDRNYATMLQALVDEGMTSDQIEAALGRTLSLNARMALRYLAERGRGT